MSDARQESQLEDMLDFAKKHPPSGLEACSQHTRIVGSFNFPVIQFELLVRTNRPPCIRSFTAIAIGDEIRLYDSAWFSSIEAFAASYEKYSGKSVKVVVHEHRGS